MPSREWMFDAECNDNVKYDPDLWLPEPGDSQSARLAKEICLSCPVREICLQYAIDTKEREGIWGGLSFHGRRQVQKKQKREAELADGNDQVNIF